MQHQLISADFWRDKRVLITGHTGFKGSWLKLWPSSGARLTGVGLEPDTTPNLLNQMELEQLLERHHIADMRKAQDIIEIVQAASQRWCFTCTQPLVRRTYTDPLGTWATNVQGSLHLLEALKLLQDSCAVVMVTTDKVYENQEWTHGYRETDRLGGHDPYSASKAGAELAIASWRDSFCGNKHYQTPHLAISTARAGNVIGGGDWAANRIVPDAIRALAANKTIEVRNPMATRPWQHVLEPLSGYLRLAEHLMGKKSLDHRSADAFNFCPCLEAHRTGQDLVKEMTEHWSGTWRTPGSTAPHEASRLNLQIDKAHHQLGWRPRWDFKTTVARTVNWYKEVSNGGEALTHCLSDIAAYQTISNISDGCAR